MHLSYNLIKENRVLDRESKIISTEVILPKDGITSENNEDFEAAASDAREYIENYKEKAEEILTNAKEEKERLLNEAEEKSKELEKEAYEKGYEQGINNGHEDGKKEAYDSCVPDAMKYAEEIKAKADELLRNATSDYESYLDEKKQEILELSVNIAQKILKREVNDKAAINSLVDEAVGLSKGAENMVIKCNEIHVEELKKHITKWKTIDNIKGDIFILPDESMEQGNAKIEKSTGVIEVGIDIGLEKIKNAIL